MHSVAAEQLEHRAKAYSTATTLHKAGDEWAAVCYFYAAYRAIRAAFYNDSRLNSDAGAKAVDERLSASSRHVSHHNGHPMRGLGVNDVVRILYPKIWREYVLLHTKSCEVRYKSGLTAGSIDDMKDLADRILAELERLSLI